MSKGIGLKVLLMQDFQNPEPVHAHRLPYSAETHSWILPQRGIDMKLLLFLANSIALGFGLSMDAFSVSIANGLADPHMSRRRTCGIAGCFAWFQFLMPMVGWICVHSIAAYFEGFRKCIPWIALVLLLGIGGKMLLEGLRSAGRKTAAGEEGVSSTAERENLKEREKNRSEKSTAERRTDRGADGRRADGGNPNGRPDGRLGTGGLILQGIATSIDALSVGFTISGYSAGRAFAASVIIAVVTFAVCLAGLLFGKRFGEKLADKASVLGGVILIAIGIEIFATGLGA